MAIPCPICGGELAPSAGEVFVACRYCHASIIVEGSSLVTRYLVRKRLGPDSAGRALLRWMSGNEPVKGLPGGAKVESPSLVWLPVWYARSRQGGAWRTHELCADGDLVPEVRRRLIPPSALRRLDDDQAPPDLPAPKVPLSSLQKGELDGREVIEQALVHVPFYRFSYRYRDQHFTAAVDAASGEVRPGRFPKKPNGPFVALSLTVLASYLFAHIVLSTSAWSAYGSGAFAMSPWLAWLYLGTFIASAACALLLSWFV